LAVVVDSDSEGVVIGRGSYPRMEVHWARRKLLFWISNFFGSLSSTTRDIVRVVVTVSVLVRKTYQPRHRPDGKKGNSRQRRLTMRESTLSTSLTLKMSCNHCLLFSTADNMASSLQHRPDRRQDCRLSSPAAQRP
jgi:hypothetical protein